MPALLRELGRRCRDLYRSYRRRVRGWRPRIPGYDARRGPEEPPLAAEQTTAPGRYVVLYDGLCKFCRAGANQLIALARPGAVELVNFQEPGALERFPGISFDACMRQMYLVRPDGRVYGGFEAAVQAVATRPVLGLLAYAYYLPGLRLACDLLYAHIAANRYRILGKAVDPGECAGGTCALHSRLH
jgi:predicted DCC family thiol-disulfide oxidoreductase YuxK